MRFPSFAGASILVSRFYKYIQLCGWASLMPPGPTRPCCAVTRQIMLFQPAPFRHNMHAPINIVWYVLSLSLSLSLYAIRRDGMKKGHSIDDRAPFMLLNCSRDGEILHRPGRVGSVLHFSILSWNSNKFLASRPYLGLLSQLSPLKSFHRLYLFGKSHADTVTKIYYCQQTLLGMCQIF